MVDGWTVYVQTGTYTEHVVINKSISVVGQDAVNTLIIPTSNGAAVRIVDDNVFLSGFTIVGRNAAGVEISGHSTDLDNITIDGVIIENTKGAGILVSGGADVHNLTVSNSSIHRNYEGIVVSSDHTNVYNFLLLNTEVNYNKNNGVVFKDKAKLYNPQLIDSDLSWNGDNGLLIDHAEIVGQLLLDGGPKNQNGEHGIYIKESSLGNFLVKDADVSFNEGSNIAVDDSMLHSFGVQSTAVMGSEEGNGLRLEDSMIKYLDVTDSYIRGNDQDGILLDDLKTKNLAIDRNRIMDSGRNGITLMGEYDNVEINQNYFQGNHNVDVALGSEGEQEQQHPSLQQTYGRPPEPPKPPMTELKVDGNFEIISNTFSGGSHDLDGWAGLFVAENVKLDEPLQVHFNDFSTDRCWQHGCGGWFAIYSELETSHEPGRGVYRPQQPMIDAENNWWGCNWGPNHMGCSKTFGVLDKFPWLILTVDTAAPTVAQGDSTTVTAGIFMNSLGEDTSLSGIFIPDGKEIKLFSKLQGFLTKETTVDGKVYYQYVGDALGVDKIWAFADCAMAKTWLKIYELPKASDFDAYLCPTPNVVEPLVSDFIPLSSEENQLDIFKITLLDSRGQAASLMPVLQCGPIHLTYPFADGVGKNLVIKFFDPVSEQWFEIPMNSEGFTPVSINPSDPSESRMILTGVEIGADGTITFTTNFGGVFAIVEK